MFASIRHAPVSLLLGILACIVMGALLVFEQLRADTGATAMPAAGPPHLVRLSSVPDKHALDTKYLLEIDRRPLFSPTRQPIQPPSRPPEASSASKSPKARVVAGAIAPPLPALVLVGIVISGGKRLAVLRPTGGTEQVVRAGQKFKGWLVEDVAPDQVTLTWGRAVRTLRFPTDEPLKFRDVQGANAEAQNWTSVPHQTRATKR